MTKTSRQRILIVVVSLILLGTALSGYIYWDALVVAAVALLMLTKKFFTFGSILMLLKKLPLLIVVGSKKIILKVLGGLLLLSARTRFRWAKWAIVNSKLTARYITRRLRYHWNDMAFWERSILIVASVPIAVTLLAVFLMLAFIPKSIRGLFIRKAQETTAAKMIDKAVPKSARKRVESLHDATKEVIRTSLSPTDDNPSGDASSIDESFDKDKDG